VVVVHLDPVRCLLLIATVLARVFAPVAFAPTIAALATVAFSASFLA
jgi:hypothetical protein